MIRIVYIKWIDAAATESYHKDVNIPKGQGLGLQINSSAGIVIEDTKEYIALALTLSDNGWFREIINIPKVNIILETVLQEE